MKTSSKLSLISTKKDEHDEYLISKALEHEKNNYLQKASILLNNLLNELVAILNQNSSSALLNGSEDLAKEWGQKRELWFQQDGATCHTARATIDLLKDTFGDRLISRFGPVNWPPRSCDLTPLDYFLWGYVKSLVYADKPQTLDHLEDNIRGVIADIRPQMLEKVIEN
ncbi:DUF4817 domain-containing protein [Trichonephila clavipes]|uniref:DUF4817 domain-containing protein n=1 Tax=Trichonephila clavipes TaxID=2585209 RepID=A0A8X6RVM3_TRICX|nr:DUF4817 domain-containing protein [Trichonephila clavipes]